MRYALLALLLLVPALLADNPDPKDPKAPVAREIKLTGAPFPIERGAARSPTKVTSAEELAKLIPDKDQRARVLEQVDLKKEYLLVFAWRGSGGDKITFTVEKGKAGPEAVFTVTPGITRSLKQHRQLYAIPRETTWRVGK
jgi:hypothetical protein